MRIFFWPPTSHTCIHACATGGACGCRAATTPSAACVHACRNERRLPLTSRPTLTVKDRFLYSTVSTLKPAATHACSQAGQHSERGGEAAQACHSLARNCTRACAHAPMVGMVVTTSPSFILYSAVVFPAASRPSMRMRISSFTVREANNLQARARAAVEAGCLHACDASTVTCARHHVAQRLEPCCGQLPATAATHLDTQPPILFACGTSAV